MYKVEFVKEECIKWIQSFFDENGKDCNAIVGISGGKDSSVVAALCVQALGRDKVIGVLLLIPSAIGFVNTRVNYDILSYLPKDINTMIGQDILKDEFGQGGFSLVMVEGMSDKDVAATADKIKAVDHVSDVISVIRCRKLICI